MNQITLISCCVLRMNEQVKNIPSLSLWGTRCDMLRPFLQHFLLISKVIRPHRHTSSTKAKATPAPPTLQHIFGFEKPIPTEASSIILRRFIKCHSGIYRYSCTYTLHIYSETSLCHLSCLPKRRLYLTECDMIEIRHTHF